VARGWLAKPRPVITSPRAFALPGLPGRTCRRHGPKAEGAARATARSPPDRSGVVERPQTPAFEAADVGSNPTAAAQHNNVDP
jgi:hypothetical protein